MPKYTISDISKGMKVYKEQLSEIHDIWIILYRPKDSDMKEDGIIGYIGTETNAESDALYSPENIMELKKKSDTEFFLLTETKFYLPFLLYKIHVFIPSILPYRHGFMVIKVENQSRRDCIPFINNLCPD